MTEQYHGPISAQPEQSPRPEEGRLAGKTALVTGGSSGIGAAVIERFAQEGAVRIYSVSRQASAELAEKLHPYGTELIQIEADMAGMWPEGYTPTEEEKNTPPINGRGAAKIVEEVRKGKKKIDIGVWNAGMRADGMIEQETFRHMERAFATNVFGHRMLTKGLMANRLIPPGSSLIYNATTLAVHGQALASLYTATKGAMIGEAKSLAQELARFDIRVNVVAPGMIKTDFVDDIWEASEPNFAYVIPLRRTDKPIYGEPDDVAGPVLFFADSKDSRYVTGQVLIVDGGMGGAGAALMPMSRAHLMPTMPEQAAFLSEWDDNALPVFVSEQENAVIQRMRNGEIPIFEAKQGGRQA